MDLDLPEGSAPAPAVFYSRLSWDPRAGRTALHLGHYPQRFPETIPVAWAPAPGAVSKAIAGLVRGPERLVLLGAPRGPGLVLGLLRSTDGGRTWERPLVLAEDADPEVPPRFHFTEGAEPILVYSTLGGQMALLPLELSKGARAAEAPKQGKHLGEKIKPPAEKTKPAPAGPQIGPRVLLGAGKPRPILGLCRTSGQRIYLLDGHGRPWVGSLPGGPGGRFVRLRPGAPGVALPGLEARGLVRLACFEGRVALAWSEGEGRFSYATCDGETCGKPERVSSSRLQDVLLAATRRSILVLARDGQVIFQRRDPGCAGILASARPVAYLQRPVRSWALVPGHDAQRLALLVLDGGLGRLRTADGGRRWAGD
jgi:hypothetical protein